MKVLWISNHPKLNSGYGSQSRQAGLRIAKAGYDIEFVANDGTRGDAEWNGLLVRGSSGQDKYSRDALREDLARSGADQVIFLYDAWTFTDRIADPFADFPRVAGWVPVDHFPTPRSLYPWLAGGHTAIAMSQFGRNCLTTLSNAWQAEYDSQLREARGDRRKVAAPPGFPVRYAPHAVDDVFHPDPDAGAAFRQSIQVPADAFLVGIVAANNGTRIYDRKGFSDMAHAVAILMAQRPDAYVYVHTIQSTFDGIDLPDLFDFKGADPSRIRWADQYRLKKQDIGDDEMRGIYASFSVLLGTSRGEGFGLPGIECQAVGVPAILSNWTAQAELIDDAWDESSTRFEAHPNGWLVPVDPDYDCRHGADFAKPLIGSIIRALYEAYDRRGDPAMSAAAVAKAEQYRADAVFEKHWRPILAEMEAGLRPPVNLALRPRKKNRAA